ncbi:hypothetical protein VTJ49DRAFT_6575 [Mycothermus thermophilus]|uniref:Glycosyltransferase n=1 Tax=Humicola insolens TaxID=85995 RepID=A0ABR3VJB0_HUMIN
MTQINKPFIVAAAFNASGHTAGLLRISEHLVSRGFPVRFIVGSDFKASMEKIGAEFVENPWRWESVVATKPPEAGQDWIFKHVFGDTTPIAHQILKETLESIRREHPNRQVIILHESMAGAVGPLVYGAPLPEGYSSLPPVINFHPSIYATQHERIPPFGPGFRYDPTPENLALWKTTYEAMEPAMSGVVAYYDGLYKSLGATRPVTGSSPLDVTMHLGDVNILATSPSLEYLIPVPNPKLRFIGGMPVKPLDPAYVYPDWWSTVTTNAALSASSPDKKRVVFVTQGTVHRDYADLILPTLEALADRQDILIIATLGARDASLDEPTPSNASIAEYLPYEAVLPYTDVFVSNAGYGGVMTGVMHGVPMVLAGTVADKAEVCARAEYAGVAVNLGAQRPSSADIRAAVDAVLADDKVKRRAMELRRENEGLDALGTVERIVKELAARDGVLN